MTTNLEKALLQLGVVKTSPTNVGIATTTFEVINPNNLCSYTNTGVTTTASYNSAEAANDYLNSVEWRKPDGTISMSLHALWGPWAHVKILTSLRPPFCTILRRLRPQPKSVEKLKSV